MKTSEIRELLLGTEKLSSADQRQLLQFLAVACPAISRLLIAALLLDGAEHPKEIQSTSKDYDAPEN